MPEHAGEASLFRAELRKTQLAARSAIATAEKPALDKAINGHLWQSLRAHDGISPPTRTIGFCLPFQGECDLRPVLEQLIAAGWHASVPVVTAPATPMVFRHWWPQAPLTQDRHGIAIPDTASCLPPAVLLLPLLAVDEHGYRLGYGGGYFDRTLAALGQPSARPLCLGVGYAQARVATIRPRDHDQALDALVTEHGIRPFTPRGAIWASMAPRPPTASPA